MRVFLFMVVLLCAAGAVFAQVQLDKNIAVDPLTRNIDIYLQPKSVDGWSDPSKWTVVAIDQANNVRKVDLNSIQADAQNTMFSLIPADTSAGSAVVTASQLIVKFGPKTLAVYQIPPPTAPAGTGNKPTIGPASNKQNSDLYVSFAYSPAIHSAAQYSIDTSVGLMWDLDKDVLKKGQLGFVGSVKTDKRKKVDPDSYRLFLAYQNTLVNQPHGRLQGVMFTWLNGPEFDRKGNNVNFITAPYFDFPIRLFPKTIRATTDPMAVLTPIVGLEAGHNFHNAVTPDSGGGVVRGVAGASLLFRFNPKLPGFKGLELSSAYTLRLPLVREVFTLTNKVNGQDVDAPFLGKNPRHYVKTEGSLKVTDAFALTLKYEYGAIPPVFRKQDHKVTMGFSYSIRQLMGGVPSALRNK
jgi:hypothetical protein